MNSKRSKKSSNLVVKSAGISGITAIFMALAFVIFSIISVRSVRSSSQQTADIMGRDKIMSDMLHLVNLISHDHGRLSLHEGQLIGRDSVSLENSFSIVDEISAEAGTVATIFVREGSNFKRISTSIVNDAGERAVGTYLGTESAAYSTVIDGRDYSGQAVILGNDYLTLYRPVISPTNEVIGILFIGTEITKIERIIARNTAAHVWQIILIASSMLIVLIFVNTFSIIRILVKPIQSISHIINRLSLGDINLQIQESAKTDVVSAIKNELKYLVDGLQNTASFAQNIDRGNLDVEYDVLSEHDVLGKSLLEMRKSLKTAENDRTVREKEDAQRNWGTEGLAKFAEILRQDNDNMETLSYNVISNLVKYMGANQGGMFVLNDAENEAEKVLELTACYAYDRKKFVEKKIRPGEGLVGSCFLEGLPVYMTNVPDDYVNITSGLGDANPKAIYICPLKVNDVIYGVIEIASFDELEPYKRDFVNKVSESIASTISTVHVNLRTSQLLEQTKLQGEEMRNAEEELRQTMEEMQATQEESNRRERELQETIEEMRKTQEINKGREQEMQQFRDAIFGTCSVLELSAEGYITDINDNMLAYWSNPPKSVFVGKHAGELLNTETFEVVWNDMQKGVAHENEHTVTNETGQSLVFQHKFMPVCAKNGQLLKVLLLAFPLQK